jgi:dTDP-4-dehydrorhamnose 3,5-epimerase
MEIRAFEIPDIKLILPKRFADSRGYFFEAWRDNLLRQEIAGSTFVRDNQSMSGKGGTLRGLHFQMPPVAKGKLVRVPFYHQLTRTEQELIASNFCAAITAECAA